MLNLLTDVVVNFGVGSLFGNVGATLVTKSGNKVVDKIALGIGTAIVGAMVKDAASKFVCGKVEEVKDMIKLKDATKKSEQEEEVDENGGALPE